MCLIQDCVEIANCQLQTFEGFGGKNSSGDGLLLKNLKQFLEILSKQAGERVATIEDFRNAFKGRLLSKEDVLSAYRQATGESVNFE